MLSRLVRDLPPAGGVSYEPKWDGFRCLAFVEDGDVDLRSRHGRPFTRYFPEVVAALGALPSRDVVLDGEVLVWSAGGSDFPALMLRLHPAASRVGTLARETPATFVAFDLLAAGSEDLRDRPFAQRRARLESLLAAAPPGVRLTPATRDRDRAAGWLDAGPGGGVDGVMVKPDGAPYAPGARTLLKVKRERTADCVVAGFRFHANEPRVGSLLLGLYDDADVLRHVGVAASFARGLRAELTAALEPLVVPLTGHPWEYGFALEGGPIGRLRGAGGRWDPRTMPLDWAPVRPERVTEIAHTQVDAGRLRHPGRFRRWRPDREPGSCRLEQLAPPAAGIEPLRGGPADVRPRP